MRVLGIDPGLRNMGWGIIEVEGSRIRHVANGVCKSAGQELATRLLALYEQLSDVVASWSPDTAAVEQTFVNKDAVATLKLGQARSIALLAFAAAAAVAMRPSAAQDDELIECPAVCDLNGDGLTNVLDVVQLVQASSPSKGVKSASAAYQQGYHHSLHQLRR